MSTPQTERDESAGMHGTATDQLSLGLDDDAVDTATVAFVPSSPEPEPEPELVDDSTGHLFEQDAAPRAALPKLSLGARLRNAREARGLGLEQVSRGLRIPGARLAEIEDDRFDAVGAPVYLRGYLRSYARLVGLPDVVVTAALAETGTVPPPLVATQTVSRSHYITSRYGSLLVYGVLTAVFVVPLLWAARQGALLPEARPSLASLDGGTSELAVRVSPPPVLSASDPGDAAEVGPPEVAALPAPDPLRPVMAAMAPMPSAAAAAPEAAGRTVALVLTQASWIELTSADGKRLEYALLPAGSSRSYDVGEGAELRIGNSRGASVAIDGTAVDLAPLTRANVARVAIPAISAR